MHDAHEAGPTGQRDDGRSAKYDGAIGATMTGHRMVARDQNIVRCR